uniref:Protein TIFY n=1 Tax=Oryza punctata TaxID=4537 RepID=A0A0E0M793_ORYPU
MDSAVGRQRRFAVACRVLSRCVKATAASSRHRPTMLLMPGADVVPDVTGEEEEGAGRLKIMYGGRMLVFDDFPAESAVELVRAAARGGRGGFAGAADLPVVRKGSLQRFVEKRRCKLRETARAPFAANAAGKDDGDAGRWLALGTPGSGLAAR